jgi:NitT/TauT family transport system substrate-binding protein
MVSKYKKREEYSMNGWAKVAAGALAAAVLVGAALAPVGAEEMNAELYGAVPTAMPWAVAMEENFFKDFGVDMTGIRNATGGNAVRVVVAGELAYGDGSPNAVIQAVQNGADLKIVSDNTHNASGVAWVVMPNSPLKTAADIKGKRLTYTQPGGSTQAWAYWILNKLGYTDKDVELISAGNIPGGLTLLEHGGADVAVIDLTTLAKNEGKYRVLIGGNDASIFPAMSDTVGYVSAKVAAEKPEVIKGIIKTYQKSVQFMTDPATRPQAAADIAKVYKTDPALIKKLLDQFIDQGAVDGVPFYGEGNINSKALQTAVDMSRLVGAVSGDIDINKIVDTSYLPDDLKAKSN